LDVEPLFERGVPVFLVKDEESVTSAGHALINSVKAWRDHGRTDAESFCLETTARKRGVSPALGAVAAG